MVEWKKLGELSTVQRGKRLTKKLLSENEVYPVYHGGIEPLGYFKEFNRLENTVMVINVGASAGSVGFSNQKFWSSDGCFCISHNKFINNKYLYFFLLGKEQYLRSQVRYAGIPTLDSSAIEKIQIPIPPLSEQNRIVGILDTFTKSIENLKKQITERKKQYEHYRDQLYNLDNWEIKRIGETTKVFTCPRVYKNQWASSGVPFWRSSDVISFSKGVPNPKGNVYISEELYNQLSNNNERILSGDILVTGGGTIGIPFIKKDDSPLFVKDADLICIKKSPSLLTKFLFFYFDTSFFKSYLKKITHDATIAHYTINQILSTPVPKPSLSIQSNIVQILDTFEVSIANLEQQLTHRQKQYEYYRNMLLTFDE